MFNRKSLLNFTAICACAFAGGYVAQLTLHAGDAQAATSAQSRYLVGDGSGLNISASSNASQVIQRVADERNVVRMDFGIYNGQPQQNFYGDDGKARIQIGTYPGATNIHGSEGGLPMMGFSDNSGNLKMLFRLAGANQSPVIIMKDNQHRDRIVMGLALNDGKQEPFLATYDNDGNKKMIFGDF